MIERFLRAIAERILRREMLALHHYRVHLQEYEQWFASEDDIVRVLRNLRGQCEPEGLKGTTGISALRDTVRRQREMQHKLHAALDHVSDKSDKRRDAEAVEWAARALFNETVIANRPGMLPTWDGASDVVRARYIKRVRAGDRTAHVPGATCEKCGDCGYYHDWSDAIWDCTGWVGPKRVDCDCDAAKNNKVN